MLRPAVIDNTNGDSLVNLQPSILMVEDDYLIRSIHTIMLQDLKCVVETAATAQEALEKADYPYDLILLDVGLPDMKGTELAAKLRLHPRHEQMRLAVFAVHNAQRQAADGLHGLRAQHLAEPHAGIKSGSECGAAGLVRHGAGDQEHLGAVKIKLPGLACLGQDHALCGVVLAHGVGFPGPAASRAQVGHAVAHGASGQHARLVCGVFAGHAGQLGHGLASVPGLAQGE